MGGEVLRQTGTAAANKRERAAMSKAKKATRALDAHAGQPQGGLRAWLAKLKTALPALGALLPSVVTAVAIAATVGAYTPLTFDPDSIVAEASEAVAALTTRDADEEVAASADASVAGEPTAVAAVDMGDLQDGTYTGTAYGYKSYITVEVTIRCGKIVAIRIVSQADDPAYFNKARAVIKRVLKAQSTDVDVVSGCTYSSNGILAAIANALAKAAGGSSSANTATAATTAASSSKAAGKLTATKGVDLSSVQLQDGTYTGTAYGYKSYITVAVTIKDGAIAAITIVSEGDDEEYFDQATAVIGRVLKAQSTDVDVVSGCTYSSKGILAAIEAALAKAAGTSSGSSSGSSGGSGSASTSGGTSVGDDGSAAGPATVAGLDVGSLTLADGTYTGCGDGYGVYYYAGDPIEADVTIESGVITGIELYNYSDDLAYYSKATAVADSVLESQSTNVDVVSGCTYSSKGILAAIEDALAQAAAAAASDDADGDDAGGDDAGGDDASDGSAAYADGTYVTYALCGQGATDFDAYYLVLTTVIEEGSVASMTAYGTMSTDGSTLSGSYDEENDDYIELALNTGVTVRVNGVRTKIAGLFTQLVENGTDPDECDVITGATYSSNAILTAYKAAIEAASSSTLATAAADAAKERLAAASEGIFLEVLANAGEG